MKKVTLQDWAREKYQPPPNKDTLRRWARDSKIFPPPEKVGRTYYVEPTAEYIDYRHVS